jgi:hypothetical protein
MPTKLPKAAPPGRLIGYARVSTEEQGTDPQLDELRAAGCATVLEEHASGSDRSRPVLARLLHEIRPGETLVVVSSIASPARSATSSPSSSNSRPPVRISAAYATRSTPPRHKACSRCRCWVPSPNSNGL